MLTPVHTLILAWSTHEGVCYGETCMMYLLWLLLSVRSFLTIGMVYMCAFKVAEKLYNVLWKLVSLYVLKFA